MADRQQDKLYNSDDGYDGAGTSAKKADADPLAELARLIGQADPLSKFDRSQATPTAQPDARDRAPFAADDHATPGPPPWMQNRAAAQQPSSQSADDDDIDLSAKPHPLHRYAQSAAPAPDPHHSDLPDHAAPMSAADADPHHPAGQYDDALYGQYDDPAHDPQQAAQAGYPNDAYAYPDEYSDENGPRERSRRRGGIMTVAAVVALAVIGTGAAFGYRTYIGSPRSGEPPVIKADVTPTKVVPPTASGDPTSKLIQDRLGPGSGAEKLVSREETPVDVKNPANAGPRVVFPPLNQNANPPSTASVAPANKPLTPPPVTPGDEPRKIRTLTVRGDQTDVAATPAAKPAPRAPATARAPAAAPANANASANAPLSLSPQGQPAAAEPRTRVAAAPSAPAVSGGGYVVQVASQRNEADAQASYRALQGKYPSVLGSRSPLIKRADLGDKGVYYRAMVGPFGSPDEAAQMCGSLKTAGGQCVVQRN